MDVDQPCEYLQRFQKYHFLFIEKKVIYVDESYLQGDDYEDCSLMFGTQYKFLDPLDSQSTQTKPSSYQHNVSPT